MLAILLLSLLLSLASPQQIVYSIVPTNAINLTQASPSACYANCRSCQTLTNQCEECFDPYFVKAQDGSCQLADNYTVSLVWFSSSHPPMRFGQAMPLFIRRSLGEISRKLTANQIIALSMHRLKSLVLLLLEHQLAIKGQCRYISTSCFASNSSKWDGPTAPHSPSLFPIKITGFLLLRSLNRLPM